MKTKTDEEIEEVRQLNAEVTRLNHVIRQMSPEKRAYCIVKSFLKLEDPNEKTRERFHRWLFSPGNDEAKNKAIERCFDEEMNGCFEEISDNYFEDQTSEAKNKVAVV